MSSEMRMHDDEGRCLCGCTENCAVAAELRGEITRLRAVVNRMVEEDNERFASEALLARTEAGADVEWNAHSERLYELNAAPVADGAVAWTDARGLERLREGKQEMVSGKRLGSDTVALFAHPQDASGNAVTDAMVERAMNTSMPGGSTAWVWLFNCEGGMRPEDKHRDWFRRVLNAAMQAKEAK